MSQIVFDAPQELWSHSREVGEELAKARDSRPPSPSSVSVFLYDGAIVPDPEEIITGGHENKTARMVAVREGEKINAPALEAMFEQIIANNRAGGLAQAEARSLIRPLSPALRSTA